MCDKRREQGERREQGKGTGKMRVCLFGRRKKGFVQGIHKSDKDNRLIIMLILLLKTCNFPKAA